jgi:hypothetical protein
MRKQNSLKNIYYVEFNLKVKVRTFQVYNWSDANGCKKEGTC